jgi:hypothetical protein
VRTAAAAGLGLDGRDAVEGVVHSGCLAATNTALSLMSIKIKMKQI